MEEQIVRRKVTVSEETLAKMRDGRRKLLRHTEETKKIMSERRKGIPSYRKGLTWKVIDGRRVWLSKEFDTTIVDNVLNSDAL